ncbi:MAG: aldo/keto reductase [Bryobacteraceae bacterium]|nr:aldo/keto reductase [Bryobacteraceae bacterium]MDW8376788.1 aldo/keto reductase [Bryobacterales bacterium]
MQVWSRREFFGWTTSMNWLADHVLGQTTPASATGIPRRVLGRTGVKVSIIGLGGWHLGAIQDRREAIRIMHAAIDEGVNFFDNAWDYQMGGAETVMGEALAQDGKRKKVFLMTKNCERDYAGSMKNLEDSLRRLKTDFLDLWQFHEMVYDNDPDWVFDKGGLKAALEAKKQGKVRFIGFTGHKDPRIHLKMLAKPYAWDTAQMPVNVLDATYRSFQNEVIPVCLKKNVGVIGMKGLAGGWPQGRLISHMGLSAEECYRYCLSLPISVQVMGIHTMEQLKADVALARNFQPLSASERQALLEKVKDVAGDGRHELFKSTKAFDGPHHRRQHEFDTSAGL